MPVDSTRPKIWSLHPALRSTRSAPESAPRLLTLPRALGPLSEMVRSQLEMTVIGPPPGAWLAQLPEIVPADSTRPSMSITFWGPLVIVMSPPEHELDRM